MRSALLAIALLSCARPRPPAFVAASARAARAAHAGRHAESASLWGEAASLADRPRDADDARYRAAVALRRGGQPRAALSALDGLASRATTTPIAMRARLAAAVLRVELGEELARAEATLAALVVEAPDTGTGARALAHRLRRFDELGDAAGATRWLRALHGDSRVGGTALEPSVSHLLALRLRDAGSVTEAISLWERLFERVGYGRNPRWDDGHLALAEARLGIGEPRAAVAAIDAMFEPWTTSWFVGSYTGPRMPEAAMLRARIYRDRLRDPDAAAEAYRFVYERLVHSTLRDDALAESAAMLEPIDPARACALWGRLYRELPCSPRARRGGARPECGLAAPRCERRSTR